MKKKSKKVNVKKLTKHIKKYKNTCLNDKQELRKFNEKIDNLIKELEREHEKQIRRILFLGEF